jgi:hypothetical protein
MVHETTLVININHPYVKIIPSHVSLISREALESLPNFPLSPNTFTFTISSDPCHAKACNQVIGKWIKKTNKCGEMTTTSIKSIKVSRKAKGRTPRGNKFSSIQGFFTQAV